MEYTKVWFLNDVLEVVRFDMDKWIDDFIKKFERGDIPESEFYSGSDHQFLVFLNKKKEREVLISRSMGSKTDPYEIFLEMLNTRKGKPVFDGGISYMPFSRHFLIVDLFAWESVAWDESMVALSPSAYYGSMGCFVPDLYWEDTKIPLCLFVFFRKNFVIEILNTTRKMYIFVILIYLCYINFWGQPENWYNRRSLGCGIF